MSALAGAVDDALVFDDDEDASSKVAEICNLSSLLVEAYKEENVGASVTQCFAAVTKLLSRAEMLADPAALKAVQDEARGLEAAGTWDLESVREYADVKAEAQRSGISVHFGQLMAIASIKFWELAKRLQKTKGRIVYRGDCAKDENGAAAVYQELGANPTSVQGLNACIAYGSAPGHICTAADAVKAYVQSFLKSKHKTWIELSPELRPKLWREKFVRPVVLLIRALYGHPDAGGLWEAHLKEVLKGLGGVEIQEYPGNFWFAEDKLMLSTYVDDLTLAGPRAAHAPFWDKLCALVNVEPPEPIYRILGRNHVYLEHTLEDKTKVHALAFEMSDYAQQTIDLYKSIAKVDKIRNASTPFLPEGSFIPSDEEVKGELSGNAAKILMKSLWLARLARPDILRPINELATRVQRWTRADDKKVLRPCTTGC